ncbi:MAG: hypothetical protein A4E59_03034 [Syntrophorhabdus sp. PtaB.Bin027]|nr:MAG: hypothetical protein A4E59_03034 [Syntrophorhabdus sp. PtaB.Bin027]
MAYRFRVTVSRFQRSIQDTAAHCFELATKDTEFFYKKGKGCRTQLTAGFDPHGTEFLFCVGANAPQLFHRKRFEDRGNHLLFDPFEAIGLCQVTCQLGYGDVRAYAYGTVDAELFLHCLLDSSGHLLRASKKVMRSCDIEEYLINGVGFSVRGEAVADCFEFFTGLGIPPIAPGDKDDMWAELLCLTGSHSCFYTILSRLVRRGGDDRSFTYTGNCYGLSFKIRVVMLLNRGEKGIHVNAKEYPGHD